MKPEAEPGGRRAATARRWPCRNRNSPRASVSPLCGRPQRVPACASPPLWQPETVRETVERIGFQCAHPRPWKTRSVILLVPYRSFQHRCGNFRCATAGDVSGTGSPGCRGVSLRRLPSVQYDAHRQTSIRNSPEIGKSCP